MVVEHLGPLEQVLGDCERAVRVAGQQDTLREVVRGTEVVGADLVVQRQAAKASGGSVFACRPTWETGSPMAKRPSSPAELREAVERTVQATLGSAERQRERTQGALDDLAGTVEQLRKGAEASLARGRKAVTGAIESGRPATYEDIRELHAELRRIGRRLDAIEERLPAKRTRSGGAAKRAAPKRSRSS
jgi:hypothetical protein